MSKVGTVAYLPPPGISGVEAFVRNVSKYKTEYPLYFYSDAPGAYPGMGVTEIPDVAKAVSYRNVPLSCNNSAYARGIDVALTAGLDYMLYLETDVRVRGDYWDGKIFKEFFKPKDCVIGGSASVWNLGFQPASDAFKIVNFINKHIKITGRMPLVFQSVGRDGQAPPMLFANGAISIVHTPTADAIFGGRKYDFGAFCANTGAWDLFCGRAFFNEFKMEIFDRFAMLPSVYSGYRDMNYSLSDRKAMLTSGAVVAVHQIKDPWVPDE